MIFYCAHASNLHAEPPRHSSGVGGACVGSGMNVRCYSSHIQAEERMRHVRSQSSYNVTCCTHTLTDEWLKTTFSVNSQGVECPQLIWSAASVLSAGIKKRLHICPPFLSANRSIGFFFFLNLHWWMSALNRLITRKGPHWGLSLNLFHLNM